MMSLQRAGLVEFLGTSIVFGGFLTMIGDGIDVIGIFFEFLRGLFFLLELGIVVRKSIFSWGLGSLFWSRLVDFMTELIEVIHDGEFLDFVVLLKTFFFIVVVIDSDAVLLGLVWFGLFWG